MERENSRCQTHFGHLWKWKTAKQLLARWDSHTLQETSVYVSTINFIVWGNWIKQTLCCFVVFTHITTCLFLFLQETWVVIGKSWKGRSSALARTPQSKFLFGLCSTHHLLIDIGLVWIFSRILLKFISVNMLRTHLTQKRNNFVASFQLVTCPPFFKWP